MIVSFHPCIDAEKQIIMGDRSPDDEILELVQKASAVILPQGCSGQLYGLCRSNCPKVFPNYDKRFQYPGKTGQARLFKEYGVGIPKTIIWQNVRSLKNRWCAGMQMPHKLPFIIKTDLGHEGEGVFYVKDENEFSSAVDRLALLERSGNFGFVTQDFLPSGGKVLRVVVIGKQVISYWKVSAEPGDPIVTISRGASIDHHSLALEQEMGRIRVKEFCSKAQIDLAAIDLIFPEEDDRRSEPLFLEINYYFGRRGLGGSERYYEVLLNEVKNWLKDQGLDYSRVRLA